MRRDIFAVMVFTLICIPNIFSAENNSSLFRSTQNSAFSPGEHLVFDVMYGMIRAGTATMSIPDTQWIHGRPCYHLVATAKSSAFFSTFFKVNDRIDSWADMEGIFSWKLEKHIREGRYKRNRYEIYDPFQNVVYYKKDTIPAPSHVCDILCTFYYIRLCTLEVGKAIEFYTFGDGKVYPLRVEVHREETVTVPAGTFHCIVVEPLLQGEGLLFRQKGKLLVWLTRDHRHIPVFMKSKAPFGSIEFRLNKIGRI